MKKPTTTTITIEGEKEAVYALMAFIAGKLEFCHKPKELIVNGKLAEIEETFGDTLNWGLQTEKLLAVDIRLNIITNSEERRKL